MTFGRWLLVHSFSIFIVVMFILGYFYRDELQLQQAYQQLLSLDPEQVVASSDAIPRREVRQSPPAEKNSSVRTLPIAPAESAPPMNQSAPVIQSVPTVSEPVYQQDERLFMARKAYWNKHYAEAIDRYRQLIDEDPHNPDYLGELGNVYYVLNDYRNASRVYYRAAMLLLDHGDSDRARMLISPITAMDRQMGDQLKKAVQR